MKNIIFYFFIFNIGCSYNYAQTAGIGEVISIESKAKKIQENKNNIKKHQTELPELEKARNEKITKLNDEIAA